MGYEEEAVDELWRDVWCHRSQMQRDLNHGAGETFVIRALAHQGTMSPSQLADAMHVTTGRISAVLSALERKGQIVRSVDPSDRRAVRVELTEAGRDRGRKDMQEMRDAVCWIFSQMGERRTREFVDLVREFSIYMTLCKPGEPRPTPEEVRKAFEGDSRDS
ncbi:MarR family transcriptional regulator [Bifidobacterium sp. SO4]|uniref:MarR family winged helix-turn-helix transcriptional regulator n=1 Tax=Bifidobacterium sp. SO4 TaxID=2809030 RepID=UPI001BDCB501|nr:MarR family transcriptional regulator [Bifidobacterium sp. SO4]